MNNLRRPVTTVVAWVSKHGVVGLLVAVAVSQAVLGTLGVALHCMGCAVVPAKDANVGNLVQVSTGTLLNVVIRFGTALLAVLVGLIEAWQQKCGRVAWVFTGLAAGIALAGFAVLIAWSLLSGSNVVEAAGWLIVLVGVGSSPALSRRVQRARVWLVLLGAGILTGVSLSDVRAQPRAWVFIAVALVAVAGMAYLRWAIRVAQARNEPPHEREAELARGGRGRHWSRYWAGTAISLAAVTVAITGFHVQLPAEVTIQRADVITIPGSYGWAMYEPGKPLTIQPTVNSLAFELAHVSGAMAITDTFNLEFEDCKPLPKGMFYVKGPSAGMPFTPRGWLSPGAQRAPSACSKTAVAGRRIPIHFPTGGSKADQNNVFARTYPPARFTFSRSDPVTDFYVQPSPVAIPPKTWPPGLYSARIVVTYDWYDTFGNPRTTPRHSKVIRIVKPPSTTPSVTLAWYTNLTPAPPWFQRLGQDLSNPALMKQWEAEGATRKACADLINEAVSHSTTNGPVASCSLANPAPSGNAVQP